MALDFSPLTGPTPESGTNKGLSFFSNALDAVLQRRAAMEQERAQRAQAEDHFKQNMAFQQEQARMQEAAKLRDDERLAADSRAKQEQFKQEQVMKERASKGTAFKDYVTMAANPDQAPAAAGYLQTQGANVRSMADVREEEFKKWYGGIAGKLQIAPDPDDPEHHYDYRAFHRDMLAGKVVSPDQPGGHFPSTYKTAGHPRTFLQDSQERVFDTRTGKYADGTPVSDEELAASEDAPDLPMSRAWQPPARPEDNARAAQSEQEMAALRGQDVITFGDGTTQTVDRRVMGPEGQAQAIERRPFADPADAMSAKRQAEMLRAGMIKRTDAGKNMQAESAARLAAANALERARITGAGQRQVLSAGEAMRGKDARVVAARGAYKDWEASEQVPALVTSYQRINDMTKSVANVKAAGGSVVDQRKVLFNVAKELSGPGVLTKDDIETTVRNTAGMPAAWASKYATITEGDLGADEWKALEKFVQNAKRAVRTNSLRAARNFKTRFNEKDHYRLTVPDEVESQYQALLGRLGVNADDVDDDSNARAKAKASAQARAAALLKRTSGAAK